VPRHLEQRLPLAWPRPRHAASLPEGRMASRSFWCTAIVLVPLAVTACGSTTTDNGSTLRGAGGANGAGGTSTGTGGAAISGPTCSSDDDCVASPGSTCAAGHCASDPDYSAGPDDATLKDMGDVGDSGGNGDPKGVGAVIATFCGINAYQNGPKLDSVVNWHGQYGLEFQCTELAYRFLCQHYQLCQKKTGAYGNAKAWYTNYQDPVLKQLQRFDNSGTEPPQPGDALVFGNGKYGHVAIVSRVDEGGATPAVGVLEQNVYNGSHRYQYTAANGHYTVKGALGWMRAPGGKAACGGCGDAACDTNAGETCSSCPADCGCQTGWSCQSGQCVQSPPPCGNGSCEVNLGESCATCPADCGCQAGWSCQNGQCVQPPPHCGNGSCEANLGETCATCPADCGCQAGWSCQNGQCVQPPPHCGNGPCEANLGETCATCPADCGCQAGWSCQNGLCNAIVCGASSVPSVGMYTASFAQQQACSCTVQDPTCHALYQAEVDAVAADGWHATLRFKKVNGTVIPAGRQYWVVVAGQGPDCNLLNAYVVRASGVVGADSFEVVVPNVPIWPDQASFAAAPVGDQKNLFVISDGLGVEGQKIWFEKDWISFTKKCQ
jgi:hypothetical protein